ncbi:MAG: hypothetical protein WCV71_04975 [Patescibacteria group bacterium]|jgi:3D (Asp-Asp-Asp) domain-containing protein
MKAYPKKEGFFNLFETMISQINNSIKGLQKELGNSIKPLFLLVVIFIFSFPHATISQTLVENTQIGPIPEQSIRAYYDGPTLPEIPARPADRIMYIVVTAYNSEVGQTDNSPFITAFGTQVRDGIVATNFLPKGTIVRFPEKFGSKEFVVEDRMNSRYYYHMDIWMTERSEAVKFGAKFLKMEIL